jgi:Ca2+-binding EF-hand superfamily protein
MATSDGGTISKKVFKNQANTTVGNHLSTSMQDKLFKLLDSDHSGGIDYSEFMDGMLTLVKGDLDTQLKFAFGLYDLDGNGSKG